MKKIFRFKNILAIIITAVSLSIYGFAPVYACYAGSIDCTNCSPDGADAGSNEELTLGQTGVNFEISFAEVGYYATTATHVITFPGATVTAASISFQSSTESSSVSINSGSFASGIVSMTYSGLTASDILEYDVDITITAPSSAGIMTVNNHMVSDEPFTSDLNLSIDINSPNPPPVITPSSQTQTFGHSHAGGTTIRDFALSIDDGDAAATQTTTLVLTGCDAGYSITGFTFGTNTFSSNLRYTQPNDGTSGIKTCTITATDDGTPLGVSTGVYTVNLTNAPLVVTNDCQSFPITVGVNTATTLGALTADNITGPTLVVSGVGYFPTDVGESIAYTFSETQTVTGVVVSGPVTGGGTTNTSTTANFTITKATYIPGMYSATFDETLHPDPKINLCPIGVDVGRSNVGPGGVIIDEGGDDPRDEDVLLLLCQRLDCKAILKAMTELLLELQKILANITLYPINNDVPLSFGPIFASPGRYSLKTLSERKSAAEEFFSQVNTVFTKMKALIDGAGECKRCVGMPCYPCQIDTKILKALVDREEPLRRALRQTEVKILDSRFRHRGGPVTPGGPNVPPDTDASLKQSKEYFEKELAQLMDNIKKETEFVLEKYADCQEFAVFYEVSVCEKKPEIPQGGDDPRDVQQADVGGTCHECTKIREAAEMVYYGLYTDHINKMKATFKRPFQMKTAAFKEAQHTAEMMKKFINELLSKYKACKEKLEATGVKCPADKSYNLLFSPCEDICEPFTAAFRNLEARICEDINSSEREINDQIRKIKSQITKLTQENARNKADLQRLQNAMEQANNDLGELSLLNFDQGGLTRGQSTFKSNVESALKQAKGKESELQNSINRNAKALEELQRALSELEAKKQSKKTYESDRKEVQYCIKQYTCPVGVDFTKSLDDLCRDQKPKAPEGGEPGPGEQGGPEGGGGDSGGGGGGGGAGGGGGGGGDTGGGTRGGEEGGPGDAPKPPVPPVPPTPTDTEWGALKKKEQQQVAGGTGGGTPGGTQTGGAGGSPSTESGPTPTGGNGSTTGGGGSGDGTTTGPTYGAPPSQPCPEGTVNRDETTAQLSNLQNKCFIAPPLDLSNTDDVQLYRLVNNVIGAGPSADRQQASTALTNHINSLSPDKINRLKTRFSANNLDFENCSGMFVQAARNQCDGAPSTTTRGGSGDGTTTRPSDGPGTQARQPLENDFSFQICGKAYLENLRTTLQQQRVSTIQQGGSVVEIEQQIKDVESQLQKMGDGDVPAICKDPLVLCSAGINARKALLTESLTALGINQDSTPAQKAQQKALEESLSALDGHLTKYCPTGSLSCDQLNVYQIHLDTLKAKAGVNQTLLDLEAKSIQGQLDVRSCPKYQSSTDANGVRVVIRTSTNGEKVTEKTYPDGRVEIVTEFPDGTRTVSKTSTDAHGTKTTVTEKYDKNGVITAVTETWTSTSRDGTETTTTETRDPRTGEIIDKKTEVKDPQGNTTRTEVRGDPDKPGENIKTVTRVDNGGNTTVTRTHIDKGGFETTSLDETPEETAAACTPELKQFYDQYKSLIESLNRGGDRVSMQTRLEFSQLQKENRDRVEQLQRFKNCGNVPQLRLPCPSSCNENNPTVTRLKSLANDYHNPPPGADAKVYKEIAVNSLQRFLNDPVNAPELNQYYGCISAIKSISAQSSEGRQDPLIAQCPNKELNIPVSYSPKKITRVEDRRDESNIPYQVTVVIDENGQVTEYRKVGDQINVTGPNGKEIISTRENSDGTHTITRQSGIDTSVVTKVEIIVDGKPEVTNTDIVGGTPKKTVTTVIHTGGPTVRTTVAPQPGGTQTKTVEYFAPGTIINDQAKPEYTETSTDGRSDCQDCMNIDSNILQGYYRWQKMFRMLQDGTLQLQGESGPFNALTPDAVQKEIQSTEKVLKSRTQEQAAGDSSISPEELEKLPTANQQQLARNQMNQLAQRAAQSYQMAGQLYDEFDQWKKNLSTLPGGEQALKNILNCHELVKANKCKAPFTIESDPTGLFNGTLLTSIPSKADYLNRFHGSESGPGGHSRTGAPRKWVEFPHEGSTTPSENVTLQPGNSESVVIKVVDGNTTTITEEFKDGSIKVTVEERNPDGSLKAREVKDFGTGIIERVEISADRNAGVTRNVQKVRTEMGKPPVVTYQKIEKTDGSFEEIYAGGAYRKTGTALTTYSRQLRVTETVKVPVVQPNGSVVFKDQVVSEYTQYPRDDGTVVRSQITPVTTEVVSEPRPGQLPQNYATNACAKDVPVLGYDATIAQVMSDKAREIDARIAQAINAARTAGAKSTDREATASREADPEWQAFLREQEGFTDAVKRYEDLAAKIKNSSADTIPTTADYLNQLHDLFDAQKQYKFFPNLQSFVSQVDLRYRGAAGCLQTKNGYVTYTRGVASQQGVGTVETFVSTDRPSTALVPPTVEQVEDATRQKNACVYPANVNQQKTEVLEELVDTLRGQEPEALRDRMNLLYATWSVVANADTAQEFDNAVRNFNFMKSQYPEVWREIAKLNTNCASNDYKTSGGYFSGEGGSTGIEISVPAPTKTETLSIQVTSLNKSSGTKAPCSMDEALMRTDLTLASPDVSPEVKDLLERMKPLLSEAKARLTEINQEENPRAVQYRIQQYMDFLGQNPELYQVLQMIFKEDIENSQCSLTTFANFTQGNFEATIKIQVQQPTDAATLAKRQCVELSKADVLGKLFALFYDNLRKALGRDELARNIALDVLQKLQTQGLGSEEEVNAIREQFNKATGGDNSLTK